jgi:hypothetical protein
MRTIRGHIYACICYHIDGHCLFMLATQQRFFVYECIHYNAKCSEFSSRQTSLFLQFLDSFFIFENPDDLWVKYVV